MIGWHQEDCLEALVDHWNFLEIIRIPIMKTNMLLIVDLGIPKLPIGFFQLYLT